MCTRVPRKPHICPGQYVWSEETWEDHRLSPLAELGLSEPSIRWGWGKAVNDLAKHLRSDPTQSQSVETWRIFFFFSPFFPLFLLLASSFFSFLSPHSLSPTSPPSPFSPFPFFFFGGAFSEVREFYVRSLANHWDNRMKTSVTARNTVFAKIVWKSKQLDGWCPQQATRQTLERRENPAFRVTRLSYPKCQSTKEKEWRLKRPTQ